MNFKGENVNDVRLPSDQCERYRRVLDLDILSGSHEAQEIANEMCVMEAVAYVAGEPWSDHPECACPTITAFMVSWNDSLRSDEDRNRLLRPPSTPGALQPHPLSAC